MWCRMCPPLLPSLKNISSTRCTDTLKQSQHKLLLQLFSSPSSSSSGPCKLSTSVPQKTSLQIGQPGIRMGGLAVPRQGMESVKSVWNAVHVSREAVISGSTCALQAAAAF